MQKIFKFKKNHFNQNILHFPFFYAYYNHVSLIYIKEKYCNHAFKIMSGIWQATRI